MTEPSPEPRRAPMRPPGVPLQQLHSVLLALAAYHGDGADFAFEEVPDRLSDMIESCEQVRAVLSPIGAPT